MLIPVFRIYLVVVLWATLRNNFYLFKDLLTKWKENSTPNAMRNFTFLLPASYCIVQGISMSLLVMNCLISFAGRFSLLVTRSIRVLSQGQVRTTVQLHFVMCEDSSKKFCQNFRIARCGPSSQFNDVGRDLRLYAIYPIYFAWNVIRMGSCLDQDTSLLW